MEKGTRTKRVFSLKNRFSLSKHYIISYVYLESGRVETSDIIIIITFFQILLYPNICVIERLVFVSPTKKFVFSILF